MPYQATHEATRELLKRIRRIEIHTRRLVQEQVAGGYHSVFKGRGIEFAQSREYVPGDDVRMIDWNASARMGRPYVKLFTEERELTVMLLVDVSRSMYFGTTGELKRQLATEFCATMAFSALSNNDRVGLMLFTDRVEALYPPKKGRRHALRLIRELLTFEPQRRRTDLREALDRVLRLMRRQGTVFVVSDFLSSDYRTALTTVGKRHDTIAVTVRDRAETSVVARGPKAKLGAVLNRLRGQPNGVAPLPAEQPAVAVEPLQDTSLPITGLYALEDPETGAVQVVDLGHGPTRRMLLERRVAADAERRRLLRRADVEEIHLVTGETFVEPLVAFFRRRERHLRQGV